MLNKKGRELAKVKKKSAAKKTLKRAVNSAEPKKLKTKSKKPDPQNFTLRLNEDIYPVERDVLFRPDRLKYVRKILKPQGCVFCTAEKSGVGLDSLVLAQTRFSQVVVNKFPYNSGHLLVMPRRHEGSLLNLSTEESADLHLLLQKAMGVLQKTYSPGGFNVGLNQGAVAGAGIPDHLHYHLVPRWSGDLNFFPLIAETKTVIETIETTFNRLLPSFREI